MKRPAGGWLALGFLLGLGGCGQSSAPATTPVAASDQSLAANQDNGSFPIPDPNGQSNLFLIPDLGGTAQVKVGDDADAFKAAFPRSATKAKSLDNALPDGADKEHWTVKGWAFDDASRGVGALFYDGKVALVMSQFDSVEEHDVTDEVAKYQTRFQAALQLEGKHVRYWFWPHGSSVLMVCAFKNDQNEINLTTALGDANVMARLHMSSQTAEDDLRSVERLYGPLGAAADAVGNTQ
jgi:hypothetical protein